MSDPTSRALKLLGLLGHRTVWTGPELAAELGVTSRTLRRDVGRLREIGYVVDAEPGQGGGYSLRRGQLLPPLLLQDDEAAAVMYALTAFATGSTRADVAARALRKVDAVLPAPMRERARELRAAIDLTGARATVDQEVLAGCAEAVRRRRRLRFHYVDRRERHSERWVEPHEISCRGRAWYLAAFDVGRDGWRRFRLDRISEVHAGTWTFRRRADAAQALARLREPMRAWEYEHRVVLRMPCPVEEVPEAVRYGGVEVRGTGPTECELLTGTDDPRAAAVWLACLGQEFSVVGDDAVREAVRGLGKQLLDAVGD